MSGFEGPSGPEGIVGPTISKAARNRLLAMALEYEESELKQDTSFGTFFLLIILGACLIIGLKYLATTTTNSYPTHPLKKGAAKVSYLSSSNEDPTEDPEDPEEETAIV